MNNLARGVACSVGLAGLMLLGGCTPASLAFTVVGVATDTSMTWTIVKHLHEKATEGDPISCMRLNSVERALIGRCGSFTPGSIKPADIASIEQQECALSLAAYDPKLWPVLPELMEKGAKLKTCRESPLLALAQTRPCPEFGKSSPEVIAALQTLADTDPRAVRHDIVRMLTCPNARAAGLHTVIDRWMASGALATDRVGFGVLGAVHPDYLSSPTARRLEARGHTAQGGLGAYDGKLVSGYEEALRTSHWEALDWWLSRAPQLAQRVPATQNGRMPWLPLARVIVPTFLEKPDTQGEMVRYLMARGASPWQSLPYDPNQTVVSLARQLRSPQLALLEPPLLPAVQTVRSKTAAAGRGEPVRDELASTK
ncbi:MAG: hypothetical protein RLZZ618_1641 [Pseudomonadota bacterium]|jgi:hypothetical protein